MFDLGMQELIVIFAVVLIVFGPQKLPELARSLGKGVAELKKAINGIKDQIDTEVKEVHDPLREGLSDTFQKVDIPGKAAKEKKDDHPSLAEKTDDNADTGTSGDAGEEAGRKAE
ncbi:sec-independent protein translocase protein TatAd [bacterium BMS3Bbin07]|nr:sec-independent protein translocase protein TatAd [bacterium BMS3Bbin07]HDH02490.1 twin-arginine translocase subunit TatB [Nitrospirota bacterium]